MTSSDLENRDERCQIFLADLCPDSDQIWHANPRGEGHVIRGSVTAPSQGGGPGPNTPIFSGDLQFTLTPFDLERPKFGTVTCLGKKDMFYSRTCAPV